MIVKVPIAGKLIGMFGLPIKLSGAASHHLKKRRRLASTMPRCSLDWRT